MRRREFVALVAVGAIAGAEWAKAQSTGNSYRVGWFGPTADSFSERYGLEFVRRLGELGFNEGDRIEVDEDTCYERVELRFLWGGAPFLCRNGTTVDQEKGLRADDNVVTGTLGEQGPTTVEI